MNTNYGMRVPTTREIVDGLGSLQRAYTITGGSVKLLVFYLNNPDRVAEAPAIKPLDTEFARDLRDEAKAERVEQEANAAATALAALEKPTLTGVAKAIGVCVSTARKRLVTAGKWPLGATP